MKKFLLLIVFTFCTTNLFSQAWEQIDWVFAPYFVTVQDFSAPVFGDIDADGDFDLMIGNINLRVDYFENKGTNLEPIFRKDTSMLSPVYANGYQFTNSDYPALADLDNDNDLDLIISGYNGLIYYRNRGDSLTPNWDRDSAFFGTVNSQIGTDARPAFADMDGDGDIDLLVGIGESLFGGPNPGSTMGFRNEGTVYEPVFVRNDSLVLGIPDVGLNAYPAPADLDDDGDIDLLMGRDGAAIHYYKNTGTKFNPSFTRENTVFANVEATNYWKDPTFCDLDGDGDYDLIYGTDNGILYHYKNIGTPSAPQFIHVPQSFRVIKSDGFSTPSFADIDNDGDLDLLSGSTLGKLYHARNDGDSTSPVFMEASASFTNISPGFRSAPVFVDFDNDGDYDIVSGIDAGKLNLYLNDNGVFTQNTTILAGIQVNYSSLPTFGDIDGDGDLDLLVGAESSGGTKFFLRDTGNVFIENTTYFSGVSFPGYCSPALADIDNDGDLDLFIGRSNGIVNFWENTGDSTNPAWSQNNAFTTGIKAKQNAHPSFADLDGDGWLDMILGEYDGNFTYLRNPYAEPMSTEDLNNGIPAAFTLLQNYPNPFNPSTIIRFNLPEASFVELKVYDITGKEVAVLLNEHKAAGEYMVSFDAARQNRQLASGIYIYSLRSGNKLHSKKMIYLK
jgi:hypothetical protein